MSKPGRIALAALLFACGESPSEPVTDDVQIGGPESIAFDRLHATLTLAATTRTGEAPRWSSSLPSVASVERGVVTAVGNGTAWIIASAGGSADSVTVTVSQVATALAFLTPPEHAVRGESFLAPVRLAIVDAGGSPLRTSTTAMTVALAPGGNAGALRGTTTRAAADGVATFDDLSIDAIGAGYRIAGTAQGTALRTESTAFDVVAAADRVIGRNHAGQTIGMLIDGAGASGPFDDLGRVVPDSVVDLIATSGASNEVMAFTRGRPPMLRAAPWTPGTDTVSFSFPDPIAFPVTVWVVKGPYEQQRARAASAIATTAVIWDDERMGLSFSDVEFVDATADPDAPALFDLTLCNQQAQMTGAIGKRAGRINIYYVGTVDGGTDRGRACGGGDFTMMAERSGHELLSHEIGHLFGLGHVDGDERFDRTNVMHSASNTRRYLTEAQVFRSHYNSYSALRSVYGLRDDVARTCGDYEVGPACPSLARRLFPDGGFPANAATVAPVTEWLLTTCVVGTTSDPRAAADALREALAAGPPAEILRETRDAARERAVALRARIAAGARFGLDAAALAALRAELENGYAERRTAELDGNFRDAARRALGLTR